MTADISCLTPKDICVTFIEFRSLKQITLKITPAFLEQFTSDFFSEYWVSS